MKLGNRSVVTILPLLDILGTLFLLVSFALLIGCFLLLLLAGALLLLFLFLFRNKLVEPAGKKRPFLSRGSRFASFLPIAAFFALFLRVRFLFLLGISSQKVSHRLYMRDRPEGFRV